MGAPTDTEIEATLTGYGEWVESEGYGLVWRPYTTTVGLDFTPYETCGSWVWTEWGWTYACEWDWGWLPFHYGRWGRFDDYWAWVPGYEWSPAWVEWRGGGGYVGFGLLRALARVIERDFSLHAGSDIFKLDGKPRLGRGGVMSYYELSLPKRMNDYEWRAAIATDYSDPLGETAGLLVYRRRRGSWEMVCGDGTVKVMPEGVTRPEGIVLPREAIEAVRVAIERWQGAAGNPRTEAAVLREWLAVERARVDKALER